VERELQGVSKDDVARLCKARCSAALLRTMWWASRNRHCISSWVSYEGGVPGFCQMSDYSRDGYGDCERHREVDHASVRKFNMLTHHKCASTWIFERFILLLTAALPLTRISERYRPGANEHRPA